MATARNPTRRSLVVCLLSLVVATTTSFLLPRPALPPTRGGMHIAAGEGRRNLPPTGLAHTPTPFRPSQPLHGSLDDEVLDNKMQQKRDAKSAAVVDGNGAREEDDQEPGAGGAATRTDRYERPKAQKPRVTTMASSSTTTAANQPPQDKAEMEVVGETLALLAKRALDPFLNPAPVENHALLVCDVSLLLSFRTVEDMILTPFPSLEVVGMSSDLIKNGLLAYASPMAAAAHIFDVTTDGLTLGAFWLAAVLLGRAEAVARDVNSGFAISTWATFRTWLTVCNLRLGVLFLHVRIVIMVVVVGWVGTVQGLCSWFLFHLSNTHPQALTMQEGVDLQHFQAEMSFFLLTMLAWRWLNVGISKRFF